MADHLTEEEQIESLKHWWDENWLSIVAPIVAIVLAYGGWMFWQNHQETKVQEASQAYAALLNVMGDNIGVKLSDEQKTNVRPLAESIAKAYAGSLYADYANMLLARMLVEEGQPEKAIDYLQYTVDDGANDAMVALAKSRLAKVYLGLKEYAKAEALVVKGEGDYSAIYAEIRGDIYAARGQTAEANTAYQEAMDSLSQSQYSRRGILQLKFDNTQVATVEQTNVKDNQGEKAPGKETTHESAQSIDNQMSGAEEVASGGSQ